MGQVLSSILNTIIAATTIQKPVNHLNRNKINGAESICGEHVFSWDGLKPCSPLSFCVLATPAFLTYTHWLTYGKPFNQAFE